MFSIWEFLVLTRIWVLYKLPTAMEFTVLEPADVLRFRLRTKKYATSDLEAFNYFLYCPDFQLG